MQFKFQLDQHDNVVWFCQTSYHNKENEDSDFEDKVRGNKIALSSSMTLLCV